MRTGTESVHLWEWRRAAAEDAEGGDIPFADFLDARGLAGQAANPLAELRAMSYTYFPRCGGRFSLKSKAGHNFFYCQENKGYRLTLRYRAGR